MPANPSVSFFSFEPDPGQAHTLVTPDAVVQLRTVFAGYGGRVGAPTQTEAGIVRIIDSQYIVQLPRTVSGEEAQRYAKTLQANMIPESEPLGDFWLIDFEDPQNIGRHLNVVNREYRVGTLLSGEPNLLFQIQNHGPSHGAGSIAGLIRMFLCQSNSTSDPFSACQGSLERQRVRQAWCFLEAIDPAKRYGSAEIRVASIDSGITFDSVTGSSDHPDVDVERLRYCYSVESNTGCSGVPALDASKWHGMATYGLISAKPDNEFGIAGVAPHVNHLALEFTGIFIQDTRNYADTLRMGRRHS